MNGYFRVPKLSLKAVFQFVLFCFFYHLSASSSSGYWLYSSDLRLLVLKMAATVSGVLPFIAISGGKYENCSKLMKNHPRRLLGLPCVPRVPWVEWGYRLLPKHVIQQKSSDHHITVGLDHSSFSQFSLWVRPFGGGENMGFFYQGRRWGVDSPQRSEGYSQTLKIKELGHCMSPSFTKCQPQLFAKFIRY